MSDYPTVVSPSMDDKEMHIKRNFQAKIGQKLEHVGVGGYKEMREDLIWPLNLGVECHRMYMAQVIKCALGQL